MLTDLELKSLAPELKPYKRSDAGGLYIHVQPNGRKVWRLGYRFDNKQKTLAGGHYPDVSLHAARDWRGQMNAYLCAGHGLRCRGCARRSCPYGAFIDWKRARADFALGD